MFIKLSPRGGWIELLKNYLEVIQVGSLYKQKFTIGRHAGLDGRYLIVGYTGRCSAQTLQLEWMSVSLVRFPSKISLESSNLNILQCLSTLMYIRLLCYKVESRPETCTEEEAAVTEVLG